MRNYLIDEASFLIPKDWEDDTVNSFAPPEDAPSDFSFVITRDKLAEGDNLKAYVERQFKELAKELPQFHVLVQSNVTVDEVPALQFKFNWHSENGPIQQQQVYLVYNQKILILTATASEKFTREAESKLETILASFKFGVHA